MRDEFKVFKEYIEKFNKTLENSNKGEDTEDDKDFINCYQLHNDFLKT